MLAKELARQREANESYGDFCKKLSGDLTYFDAIELPSALIYRMLLWPYWTAGLLLGYWVAFQDFPGLVKVSVDFGSFYLIFFVDLILHFRVISFILVYYARSKKNTRFSTLN